MEGSHFSDPSWKEVGLTITSNSVVSPSGLFDAYSVVGDFSQIPTNTYLHNEITLINGTTYTISCFVKSKGYNALIDSGS